ncbi:MAG: alpha/beta fold hydrolase [Bifidobacterium psychraerophilum]
MSSIDSKCAHAAPTLKPIPLFGPDLSAGTARGVAIHCSCGTLTGAVTEHYAHAEHLSVFIPGFTGSKEDFLGFFPGLLGSGSQGRAYAAYSQRGQADSAAPQETESYALADFVSDGIEALLQFGADARPVDLVGHSFGGVVARRIAIARPELIRSLTLISSGAKSLQERPEQKAGIEALRRYGTSLLFRAAYPDLPDERQADPYTEMYRLRAHASSLAGILGISAILKDYPDVSDALSALGLPIAIMYGSEDDVWPQELYRWEADRLAVTPLIIPGAGHSAQLDQPIALSRALQRFWELG